MLIEHHLIYIYITNFMNFLSFINHKILMSCDYNSDSQDATSTYVFDISTHYTWLDITIL